MKNSKIVALVATAALLVIGAAFTSMAATYNWYQVDGIWHCKDKNGDDITQDLAKSGADYYYLDENGEMVTGALIEIDDDKYYFDEDGKMVKNDWRKVENDDDEGDEYYWYYFQNSGKAKKNTAKPVSINGKKYMFDEDAKMQYGWLGSTKDDDYAWQDAVYYAGDADDGAVKTGWQKIDVLDDDSTLDFEEQTYWFWFGTNGQKFAAKDEKLAEKPINGKKYVFDAKGVMKAEWEQSASQATAASASISSYYWFQDAETGAKLKKGWFRVVPKDLVNPKDNEEETVHWYYAKGDGTLYENVVKTINGKKYAFNEKGEMLAGLYEMDIDNGELEDYVAIDSEALVSKVTAAGASPSEIYFFGDEETDGSMKYGTVNTEIDGDEYTFLFNSTGSKKGQAVNGLKGNAWYVNGAKVKADADMKYEVFEATFEGTGSATKVKTVGKKVAGAAGDNVLISSSGSIVKNGTKKNADDIKIKVTNYKVTGWDVE